LQKEKTQRKNLVKQYLDSYQNPNSYRNNRGALKHFFEVVYGHSSLNIKSLNAQAEAYFSENRDYERDIQEFLNAISKQAPKTVKVKVSAIRVFLSENNIEPKQKFWRRIRRRIRGSRALTMDKTPSNQELRKIIKHLPVQGEAFALTLASSGIRIGEALQLDLNDITLKSDPCKITIRGEYTKTGNPRITFISKEAQETIQEWLKIRTQYIMAACKKSHLYKKDIEDSRLFPFSTGTVYLMWTNALQKAGFLKRDPSTNHTTIHPHVLRKFFRSKLGLVIPVDIVEALMGHEGYLTEVYRKYPDPEKTLSEYYSKGVSSLLVFTEAEEVSKLRVEVQQRNKQLQTFNLELQNRLARVENENVDLKRRIQQTEEKLGNLEKLIKKTLET